MKEYSPGCDRKNSTTKGGKTSYSWHIYEVIYEFNMVGLEWQWTWGRAKTLPYLGQRLRKTTLLYKTLAVGLTTQRKPQKEISSQTLPLLPKPTLTTYKENILPFFSATVWSSFLNLLINTSRQHILNLTFSDDFHFVGRGIRKPIQ